MKHSMGCSRAHARAAWAMGSRAACSPATPQLNCRGLEKRKGGAGGRPACPQRGPNVARSPELGISGCRTDSPCTGPPRPAQEHAEDAMDASKVEGDTLTDRAVLEGKAGPVHTTSV